MIVMTAMAIGSAAASLVVALIALCVARRATQRAAHALRRAEAMMATAVGLMTPNPPMPKGWLPADGRTVPLTMARRPERSDQDSDLDRALDEVYRNAGIKRPKR